MSRNGPKSRIKRALAGAHKSVQQNNDGSFYGRGLSGEGYDGGYVAALRDVLLVLNGVRPGGRNASLWRDWNGTPKGDPDEPVEV